MKASSLPRLIGVVHLPALPGAPLAKGPSSKIMEIASRTALAEVVILEKAGFDGIILENFGDTPFFKSQVPPETIAALATLAARVKEKARVPIGINVLRNDARSALAIAAMTDCDFIRVNVLTGVYATDQGLIEGNAAELMRARARLAPGVKILADVQVKHARALSSEDIEISIEEAALRAGADGVIATGATTGRAVAPDGLTRASQAARKSGVPLYIGSGAEISALTELRKQAYGIIVSSALRSGGRAGATLEVARVKRFARAFFGSAPKGDR